MKTPHKLHYFQTEILKKLASQPSLRFNEIQIQDLESEHINYHLKQLIQIDLVTKTIEGTYELTNKGKDYVNLIDDNTGQIEKQPKSGVLLHVTRINNNGETEFLVSRRLKQPYFGKVGKLTGKIRFGETVLDAAKRELEEETGLIAGKAKLAYIFRKIRKTDNGEPVQDVIFYKVKLSDLSGEFIKKTEFQENFWVTAEEIKDSEKYDIYDTLVLKECDLTDPLEFKESIAIVEEGF